MANEDLRAFIDALDKSDVTVTKWEAEFIDSVLRYNRTRFTPKQEKAIRVMIEKYERRVNW